MYLKHIREILEGHKDLIDKYWPIIKIQVKDIEDLRSTFGSEKANCFLNWLKTSQKCQKRIPFSRSIILTEKSAQQASHIQVAQYHQRKLQPYRVVADLCCGSGIDLIQMSEDKEIVYAVDLDKEILETAKYNCSVFNRSNIIFQQVKAEDFSEKVEAIYIDPDRREESQRMINHFSPTLEQIFPLLKISPNILVKLSPAFDYRNLQCPVPYTLEFISCEGELKEILLCLGDFATPRKERVAVLLPEEHKLENQPDRAEVSDFAEYLLEPDPSICRADLLDELAVSCKAKLISEKLYLLTSDQRIMSPWFQTFRIVKSFPYRPSDFQSYLKKEGIGEIVIKTRGLDTTTEQIRNKLQLKGKKKGIFFIVRLGSKLLCLEVEREVRNNY